MGCVHLIRSTAWQFFKKCKSHCALLEHHERLLALSAHGGISLPMAILLTLIHSLRSFFDADTVWNQNAFGSFVKAFASIFAATEQKLRQ